MLKNKEIAQLPKKIDSVIEQSGLKRFSEQNKELFKSLNKTSQIISTLDQSIATDYLVELRRQLSNLSEVVKDALTPTPYTEEERKRIIAKVENFADNFFQNRAVINQLLLDDTEDIEVEWLDNLKEIFADTQRFTINYPNRHMIGHGR